MKMRPKSLQLSVVLDFLGQLWLREVDLETLANINQPGVRNALEDLGGFVPEQIDSDTVEQLAVDYCQLLIGPTNQLSPIQSIWEDRKFQGEAAASMERYFKLIAGYRPPDGIIDHLGVQLNFAAKLVLAADVEPAARKIVSQFTRDHLKWCDAFLDQVGKRAETDFYRGLASITQQVLITFEEET